MKTIYVNILLLFILASCGDKRETSVWTLTYKNDEKGNAITGSKEVLLNAVREGYPVRIGWAGRRASDSTKSVEHVADASFLTILNGQEVFAQIESIIGQNPDLDYDTLRITFRENLAWTILAGTNGFSDRLTVDRFTNEVVGHISRSSTVSWFVKLPNEKSISKTMPLPLWSK